MPLFLPVPVPGAPVPPAGPPPDQVLLGVPSQGEVWLLTEGRYQRLLAQADLNDLLKAGVRGRNMSDDFQALILAQVLRSAPEAMMEWLLAGFFEPRRG